MQNAKFKDLTPDLARREALKKTEALYG